MFWGQAQCSFHTREPTSRRESSCNSSFFLNKFANDLERVMQHGRAMLFLSSLFSPVGLACVPLASGPSLALAPGPRVEATPLINSTTTRTPGPHQLIDVAAVD